MTSEEWAQCVLVLRATYTTSIKLDADAITVWFELLKDLPGASVKAAIVHMAKTTKAFPSVAEIRQLAEAEKKDYSAAWAELIGQIQREGYCGTPRFQDPLLMKVVERLGGWKYICQTMTESNTTTYRAQFRDIYTGVATRNDRNHTFASLGALNAPQDGFKAITEG